jgi:hypothetical protein
MSLLYVLKVVSLCLFILCMLVFLIYARGVIRAWYWEIEFDIKYWWKNRKGDRP